MEKPNSGKLNDIINSVVLWNSCIAAFLVNKMKGAFGNIYTCLRM